MPTGKGFLRIAIEDFIDTFHFGDLIRGGIKTWMEELEQEGYDYIINMYTKLGLLEALPDYMKGDRVNGIFKRAQLDLFSIAGLILGVVIGLAQGGMRPISKIIEYKVEHVFRTARIDAANAIRLFWRDPEFENILEKDLADGGYDTERTKGLTKLLRPRSEELALLRHYVRGLSSQSEVTNELKARGYLENDIAVFFDLMQVIPTVQELIFMQVREAFNDEFSQRFQHDEGDKSQVITWAAKQGLSEEWVNKYWRAHWQLPSPNQVFEMLHRLRPGTTENTISNDDVDAFLKAADYSPYWRTRLKEISYAPFTRVDVRRMYKTGVLTEAQVKESYLDLGYDDERAQALTAFTIAFEAEEETGIVRTSVLSAYGDGMIDRGTAETMLQGGGYDATTTAFYLDNVDFRESLEINQIKLNTIKKKFVEGLLDETTVNNEINQLNLPAERVTALLALWLTERENQIVLPSLAQIETFYELDIVTIDDFRRILKRRGYTEETVGWNIKRMDIEKAAKAQKDAEKLASDNERIQKSKTASTYQKNKSEVDLAIAQAKAETTDINVALGGDIDPVQADALKARKDELKQFIAQLNVTKAELRFDLATALDKLVQ